MKAIKWAVMVVVCVWSVGSGPRGHGAEPRRRCVQPQSVKRPARSSAVEKFVAVPFAVPVAVPVAVVQRPTLFYAVRAPVTPVARRQRAAETPDEPESSRAVAKVLQQHCAACHAADAAQGDLSLFAADGALLKRLPRQLILEMVTPQDEAPARMPPAPATALTEAELEALRQWARVTRDTVY